MEPVNFHGWPGTNRHPHKHPNPVLRLHNSYYHIGRNASQFNAGACTMRAMFGEIRSVHFVGIGGTAMAAVAVAMQEKGFQVSGSDQNIYPPTSTFLADRKIDVRIGYSEQNLAHRPELVVIGNAISRGNVEAEIVLERRMRYCSLPELLKEFFIRTKRSIVVS